MVIAGLILNAAGTFVLFFFALPQPPRDEGVSLSLDDETPFEGGTVKEVKDRARRSMAWNRRVAFLGLELLFTGFVLQLIAALR